jgi:SPP1 gp7 family putative phage head morphogenesis protein
MMQVLKKECSCGMVASFSVYKKNTRNIDPSHQIRLRKKWLADMRRRFKKIIRDIRISVVDNDCFALKEVPRNIFANTPIPRRGFVFRKDAEKTEDFIKWLSEQSDREILQVVSRQAARVSQHRPWMDVYIKSAYKKGITNAWQNLDPKDRLLDIDTLFKTPISAERINNIYARAYSDLQGITNEMDTKIARKLSQGLFDGLGVKELSEELIMEVDISSRRAEVLVRTEVMKAHNDAAIQTYFDAGLEGVQVQVEWLTAGFNVCPDCADMADRVFSLDEIDGLLPLHPNCRCVPIPVIGGEAPQTEYAPETIGEKYFDKTGTAKKRGIYKRRTGESPPPRDKVKK